MTELSKERVIDLVACDGSEAEFEFHEHVDDFLAVYEFDRRHTVTRRLAPRLAGERASCENDPPLSARPGHCSAEVTDVRRGDGHRLKRLHWNSTLKHTSGLTRKGAVPVDASVAAAPG